MEIVHWPDSPDWRDRANRADRGRKQESKEKCHNGKHVNMSRSRRASMAMTTRPPGPPQLRRTPNDQRWGARDPPWPLRTSFPASHVAHAHLSNLTRYAEHVPHVSSFLCLGARGGVRTGSVSEQKPGGQTRGPRIDLFLVPSVPRTSNERRRHSGRVMKCHSRPTSSDAERQAELSA